MPDVDAVLRAAARRIDRLDAEVLLAHRLGVPRLELLGDLRRTVDGPAFEPLVARREQGEPVAYITGRREFWSLDLTVTRDVLIPRADSETLIEAAVAYFGTRAPATILDLGTGSGALLLAALSQYPDATGVGIDASVAALEVARAQRRPARHGGARAVQRRQVVRHRGPIRPDPVQPALCRDRRNPPAATSSIGSRTPRCSPDPTALMTIAASRRGLPRSSRIDGAACIEIGADTGRCRRARCSLLQGCAPLYGTISSACRAAWSLPNSAWSACPLPLEAVQAGWT